MFDCLNRVDWDLLHRQKLVLLALHDRHRAGSSEAEALEGIIDLVDALQDEAATQGRWTFPGEQPVNDQPSSDQSNSPT